MPGQADSKTKGRVIDDKLLLFGSFFLRLKLIQFEKRLTILRVFQQEKNKAETMLLRFKPRPFHSRRSQSRRLLRSASDVSDSCLEWRLDS